MQGISKHSDQFETLLQVLGQAGIDVRQDAASCLRKLAQLIVQWNRSMNLISRRDTARLTTYHFCDSASVLPIIGPSMSLKVLDIGGSNGLPGLVLASLSPRIKVTVCDGSRKREPFLKAACEAIRENATYVFGRVDDSRFQKSYLHAFDVVVARAVAKLRFLLRWAFPLLRPGGLIVAYKGSRALEEIKPAEKHLLKHGSLLVAMASPWATWCNPLRNFVIVKMASGGERVG